METVTDFVFLGFKITVHGDCSHEIERHLPHGRKAMANLDSILKSSHEIERHLPHGRKAMANLDSILKSRDTLPIKVRLVKAIVFPVVIKKAECQRIDAFELW